MCKCCAPAVLKSAGLRLRRGPNKAGFSSLRELAFYTYITYRCLELAAKGISNSKRSIQHVTLCTATLKLATHIQPNRYRQTDHVVQGDCRNILNPKFELEDEEEFLPRSQARLACIP